MRRPSACPPLSVVAIYDDFASGIRAREASKWLEHSLGSDWEVHSHSWSFQKLERMDLRAMSIRAAAAADVIIVAVEQDTQPLPDQVRRWLDAALQQQRSGRAVLVALHDEKPGEKPDDSGPPGPLCTHLERLAGRWQTEFMCNRDLDRRLDHDFALRFIRGKNEAPGHSHHPLGIDFYSASEWGGINE